MAKIYILSRESGEYSGYHRELLFWTDSFAAAKSWQAACERELERVKPIAKAAQDEWQAVQAKYPWDILRGQPKPAEYEVAGEKFVKDYYSVHPRTDPELQPRDFDDAVYRIDELEKVAVETVN